MEVFRKTNSPYKTKDINQKNIPTEQKVGQAKRTRILYRYEFLKIISLRQRSMYLPETKLTALPKGKFSICDHRFYPAKLLMLHSFPPRRQEEPCLSSRLIHSSVHQTNNPPAIFSCNTKLFPKQAEAEQKSLVISQWMRECETDPSPLSPSLRPSLTCNTHRQLSSS